MAAALPFAVLTIMWERLLHRRTIAATRQEVGALQTEVRANVAEAREDRALILGKVAAVEEEVRASVARAEGDRERILREIASVRGLVESETRRVVTEVRAALDEEMAARVAEERERAEAELEGARAALEERAQAIQREAEERARSAEMARRGQIGNERKAQRAERIKAVLVRVEERWGPKVAEHVREAAPTALDALAEFGEGGMAGKLALQAVETAAEAFIRGGGKGPGLGPAGGAWEKLPG